MKIRIEASTVVPVKLYPRDFQPYRWYSNGGRNMLLYRGSSESVVILDYSNGITVRNIGDLAHGVPYDEVSVDEVTVKIKEISR